MNPLTVPRDPDLIDVNFIAGDLASKRDAFLRMFRLVIGNTMAAGIPIADIARSIGIPADRLVAWMDGKIHNSEVEEMSLVCIAFAHGKGLDLAAAGQAHQASGRHPAAAG